MLVGEYLDFVARLRDVNGPDRRRAINEAVAATAIEAVYNRPMSELSKGFRQRVGLAAAILHRPDLLVLDEPTEGLDPNQRVEIRQLISHLGRERTVILSTHVLGEVQYTCSRLLIINRGKIVADDTVDTLLSRATAGVRVSVEATGSGLDDQLGALPGVRAVEPHDAIDGRQRFTVVATTDVRGQIFTLAKERGWTLYELHQESGNLEDIFRDLTGAQS
jgi:ABC-2 type transport system ATP-binding protein